MAVLHWTAYLGWHERFRQIDNIEGDRMVPRATARRFPIEEWEHFLSGYPNSRALLVFNLYGADQYAWAITKDPATTKGEDAQPERASRLTDWVIERLLSVDLNPAAFPMTTLSERRLSDEDKTLRWASSLSKNRNNPRALKRQHGWRGAFWQHFKPSEFEVQRRGLFLRQIRSIHRAA